jgi:small multidrug resistance pump
VLDKEALVMFMAWALLVAAIGVEVASTAALPRTEGFRDPLWTAAVLIGYVSSIWLLTLVIREIPVSVAYAVWAGVGTAGIALTGAVLLGESMDLVKAGAIALIIAGVVTLNLQGAH